MADEVVEVKAKRTRTKYPVKADKFVETWNTVATQPNGSAAEVGKILGMPKNIVLARKANYLKAGVTTLATMPRSNARQLDIDALNKLATEVTERAKTAE